MFNRILASIGIGSAKVDTQLNEENVFAGEKVYGKVVIDGGKTDQLAKKITLFLRTSMRHEDSDSPETFTVLEHNVSSNDVQIEANKTDSILFSFVLPYQMPMTVGDTMSWIDTEIDIKLSTDPKDKDFIEVLPHTSAQKIFDAIYHLGFVMQKVDVIERNPQMQSPLPLIQSFLFTPENTGFNKINELEIVFLPNAQGIELFMERNRLTNLHNGFNDSDQFYQFFSHQELFTDVANLAKKMQTIIAINV
ncbi:MAG: hypothetical protein EAZ97_09380 [Bacteroidetes bacterium]|nr:MAG: hypothetical protein EAZ97_09380 [Bacteroidota bacterium]